ncbi:hypothetical protein [Dactylosporangium matsuzakiense]|uniref:Uncharacterized protein n=1 Tax=Dactylosporangium matsuzakiense TaxID=53360 RepID=A0A9W6KIW0_9ACTN|nr:hypothetical protein [Dactylosporangium matsuzakiense]UWZ48879.1 hypothetical protein Dmats_22255 [Dactylosporangium matsuzakiense]GLL00905.1 hypothetical protein GCM10017581_026460 [Dactylosporangium matsuzakiense]
MWFQRFGAGCGVLLGLCIAVPGAIEAFTGETAATSLVLGLGVVLAAPTATVLYFHQRAESGRFGALAFAVHLLGLGLFNGVAFSLNVVLFFLDDATVASLRAGPTGPVLTAGAAVFVLGTLLFAASMVRAGVFPKLPAIGYGLGLTLLAALAPLDDTPWTSLVHIAAGASVAWLSCAALPAARPVSVA